MRRPEQRNLVNFAVGDPYDRPTYPKFRDAFRALHGRMPQGKDIQPYLKRHPDEARRMRGQQEPDRAPKSRRRKR